MKLYYLRQEVLEDLKNNVANNLNKYKMPSNKWISEQYEEPFLEYKKSIDKFDLKVDLKNIGLSDIENVRILHSNLIFLTNSEASDERLWAGLSHSIFWEFMIDRWAKKPVKESKDILNRYFLLGGNSIRRALLVNSLSRYWWIGELIYDDENEEDPYYLLEVFKGDFITNIYTFLSSNFTSNSKIVKGVLRPILRYQKTNRKLTRKELQAIFRYANILGGSYLLDYLTVEEIESKIAFYINNKINID